MIYMYILHTLSWHSPPWQIVCHQERWCRGCSEGASQEFGRSSTAKASSGGVQGRYPRVPDARNGWVCWHCFSMGKPWKTLMETMVLNSVFVPKDITWVVPLKKPEIVQSNEGRLLHRTSIFWSSKMRDEPLKTAGNSGMDLLTEAEVSSKVPWK